VVPKSTDEESSDGEVNRPSKLTLRVLTCPASETDEVALLMFQQLLTSSSYNIEIVGEEKLISEVTAITRSDKKTALVCIGVLWPGDLGHTRNLCRRLRSISKNTKIVIGRWGSDTENEESRKMLLSEGVDHVAGSFLEARDQITKLMTSV
jgi:hypothetical protein